MQPYISKYPLELYKMAFIEFSKAGVGDFEIRPFDGALALFEGNTYRICHYEDLLWEFKTYFNDYDLIYTETPTGLWERMLGDHWGISEEDLSIDIYEAWKRYWEQQKKLYAEGKTYSESKAESWEDFKILIKCLGQGPANLIDHAVDISDITLIPILAITVRRQFKNEDEFYRKCLDILIDEFPFYFGGDENFDEIDISDDHLGDMKFYIYQPDYEYGDIDNLRIINGDGS